MPFDQMISSLFGEASGTILPQSVYIMAVISPIILALILGYMAKDLWVRYIRAKHFISQKYILLQIRLPKETFKSPVAMELFLTALHQTGGEGNWYQKYWLGQTRPWFSLEYVSIEGQVSMYIWTRSGNKSFIESSLYAQFPGIEVTEREDYSRSVHFDKDKIEGWAGELELTKEDPYPIKTYIDWGLDKDPKEEFKVDPLAPLLEFLGSVGPNQQLWIQILVRAHKKEARKAGHLWKTTDAWKDEGQHIINEILKRDPKSKVSGEVDEDGKASRVTITKGEEEVVTAIERALTKYAFDVGIRMMYVAEKGFFNPANIGGVLGSWKQFGSEAMNGFKPSKTWHGSIDYPWQDFRNMRKVMMTRSAIMAYKRRSYFHPPFHHKPFVLNSEELATIFHFPGQVAATPTMDRVPSKKAEAPANLPICQTTCLQITILCNF